MATATVKTAKKNAKEAEVKTAYKQVDHHIEEVMKMSGSEVLPAPAAWDKYDWTHQYFGEKPAEGYFIWIKEQPSCSLLGCVTLDKPGVTQQLNNLTVIEAGITVDMTGTCDSIELQQERAHQAKGKLLIKKEASLYYEHYHSWSKNDKVATNYEFFLEEGASLEYNYRVKKAAKAMQLQAKFHLAKNSKSALNILADCEDVNLSIHDTNIIEGEGASAVSTLRIVGRKGAKVKARSKIDAQAAGKGHLDCDALMLDQTADVVLVPELLCRNKDAQITHEASIGKVSDEQITYLRSRGLREDEAVDLIVRGFLEK
jgi:Fe-S cluster assembly scaffold protein SufB